MAIVDRNVLRLAVFEFIYEPTPRTVVINEALEIARRFSTFEATQFINGILDAIKRQLDEEQPQELSGENVAEDEIADVEDADDTADEDAEYAAHEIDADEEAVSAGAK
jgi:N utilization substance protein B